MHLPLFGRKSPLPVLILSVIVAGVSPASAQTVVSTDFSQAEVKSYANGDLIGPAAETTAQLTANSGVFDGSSSQWNPAADGANSTVKVVDVSGKHVVQLSEGTAISARVPSQFQTSTLKLQGTVIFTIQQMPGGGRSTAVIILTKDSWFTTGGANLFDFELSPSLALRYPGGMISQTLTAGSTYRIDFSVDCSTPVHTWGFTLYEGEGTDKPVFTSAPDMKTRNATGEPDTFLIHQYPASSSAPTSDPLLNIEKVSLVATTKDSSAKP